MEFTEKILLHDLEYYSDTVAENSIHRDILIVQAKLSFMQNLYRKKKNLI